MAPRYLRLSRRTWHGLNRLWGVPLSRFFLKEYFLGIARSAVAELQFFLLPRTAQIADDPIVILGFWRSGTTLLHELLSVDDRFCFPSTYDCLNPHCFVLTSAFSTWRSQETVRRPQDGMTMGWSTPQEDEFALLALGARSPYEGLLVPTAFEEAFRLADPEELPDSEKKRWEATFLRFLRGLSWIGARRPLLLKSPAHGYRVRTIKKFLPTAKFIVIVRDPYETLESMVNAYKAFARRFGLGACLPDDDIREAVIRERVRFETKLTSGLINHPSHRVVYIKYENLVTDPVETIQGIYRQLRLPDFERARPSLVTELVKRGGYVKRNRVPNAYWKGRLERAWGHIFARYGYRIEQSSAESLPHAMALDARSTSIALGAKHVARARTSSGVTSSAERGSM